MFIVELFLLVFFLVSLGLFCVNIFSQFSVLFIQFDINLLIMFLHLTFFHLERSLKFLRFLLQFFIDPRHLLLQLLRFLLVIILNIYIYFLPQTNNSLLNISYHLLLRLHLHIVIWIA